MSARDNYPKILNDLEKIKKIKLSVKNIFLNNEFATDGKTFQETKSYFECILLYGRSVDNYQQVETNKVVH